MTKAEIILHLNNRRDSDLRRAADMDEGAFACEAAANGEGVGAEKRTRALDIAQAFAVRAERSRRNAEVLAAAIEILEKENDVVFTN